MPCDDKEYLQNMKNGRVLNRKRACYDQKVAAF